MYTRLRLGYGFASICAVRNMAAAEPSLTEIKAHLYARFGNVMSTEEVAAALKMTVAALRMSRSRKSFPISPLEIEGRREQIYCTEDVARLLRSWVSKRTEYPLVDQDRECSVVKPNLALGIGECLASGSLLRNSEDGEASLHSNRSSAA